MKLVSVVLPCHKMGGFISEALASIGGQTYPEWEVVAVDDHGPEDGTREAVEAFAAQHPGRRIEFLRLPENRGVSAARNAGAAVANGEYLAFLDPDDVWLENHLESHIRGRQAGEMSHVTASRMGVFRDGADQKIESELGATDWEQQIFPLSLALRNPVYPSALVMPARLLSEVGGFDEAPEMQHVEDWDLWIRLVDHGAEFRFLNQVTCLYRKHEGGATADRLAVRRRLNAFGQKHGATLAPRISLATWQLVHRVDALEARLNWLQRNPLIRAISFLQRLFGSSKA